MSVDVLGRPQNRHEAWSAATMRSRTPSPTPTHGQRGKRLDRPKSTPSHLRVTFSSPVTSPKPTRPSTAVGTISGYECDRVFQVEHEATRKHNLQSHFPPKRGKPPPWQKSLDPPMVPYSTGQGYIMSKSKNKLGFKIDMESFFEPRVDDTKTTQQPVMERDNSLLVSQLQEQIEDLAVHLEEERMNHKLTKKKGEEILQAKVNELQMERKEEQRETEQKHQEHVNQLKHHMEEGFSEYKKQAEATISKLKGEREFLQGSFESFRSSLIQEMNDKWKKKEEEMQFKHEEETQRQVHDMRMKIITEKNAEKANMIKDAQKEVDALRKENKKELDALMRRFSNAAADQERLVEVEAELKDLKLELTQVKKLHKEAVEQLNRTIQDYNDTKFRLTEFETKFHEKVQEVDDKYREQIHGLMRQNTELRRLYVKKCGQLFDEKTLSDQAVTTRIESAKDAMKVIIDSRNRCDVSIAAIDPKLDKKPKSP